MRAFLSAILLGIGCAAAVACGDDKKVVNACPDGEEGCSCLEGNMCNDGLACASTKCVRYGVGGTSGSGGNAGSNGAGGDSGAAGDSGASGRGGASGSGGAAGDAGNAGNAGDAGNAGNAGNAGDAGNAGSGGSAGSAGSAGSSGSAGSGGSSGGPADPCDGAPSTVIDNFVTCDVRICNVGGRSGEWYGFADTGVNLMFGVGIPGTAWVQRCGAWATGGPRLRGGITYAGIGFQLAGGATHDLSAYTGAMVTLETNSRVWFTVKTVSGGYFGG